MFGTLKDLKVGWRAGKQMEKNIAPLDDSSLQPPKSKACTPILFNLTPHRKVIGVSYFSRGHQGESSLKRRIRSFSTSDHHRPKSTDPKVSRLQRLPLVGCFGFSSLD